MVQITAVRQQSQACKVFQFTDGVSVRQSGGLVCSKHGRYVCQHNKVAHQAIVDDRKARYEAAVDEMYSYLIDPRAEDCYPF